MNNRLSWGDKWFHTVNYSLLALLGMITLYPLLNVLAISLSDYTAFVRHPFMFIPENINLEAYKRILTSPLLFTSYRNTLFVAVLGTAFNLLMTVMTAYPLAKSKVRGDRYILFFVIFTMLFSGGMIPTFLIVKNLYLIDTLWALIFPLAISTYNFIIMKTFLEEIPEELEEAARIDGAGHLYILFRIMIPLSLPILATLGLFYAVANWNRFFEAVLYLNDRNNWTMTLLLREMITEQSDVMNAMDPLSQVRIYPKTLQSAVIIVAVLPILLVYPFLQRYFIKGLLLGAVKQ